MSSDDIKRRGSRPCRGCGAVLVRAAAVSRSWSVPRLWRGSGPTNQERRISVRFTLGSAVGSRPHSLLKTNATPLKCCSSLTIDFIPYAPGKKKQARKPVFCGR